MTAPHDDAARRPRTTPHDDDAARERLEAALADRSLLAHPAPELVRGARVVIYGAGNVGREFARNLLVPPWPED